MWYPIRDTEFGVSASKKVHGESRSTVPEQVSDTIEALNWRREQSYDETRSCRSRPTGAPSLHRQLPGCPPRTNRGNPTGPERHPSRGIRSSLSG